MKIMWWALRRLLVHLLRRVTSANISLWVWNGIQQKKKEKTTTAKSMVSSLLSSSGPGPGQVRVRKVRVRQIPAQRTQNSKIWT